MFLLITNKNTLHRFYAYKYDASRKDLKRCFRNDVMSLVSVHGNKGSKLSEEHKRRMSEVKKSEKHPMYGKTHTEETKRKMSELRKIQRIKVLKGYGVSITLEDNQVLLKDGRNPFSGEQDKESWFVS